MKKLKLILTLCSLIFTLHSCEILFDHPDREYLIIQMKLMDGTLKKGTYYLPKKCVLRIATDRGSYWLEYRLAGCFGPECFGTIKNGVIDFEVIKKYNYKLKTNP